MKAILSWTSGAAALLLLTAVSEAYVWVTPVTKCPYPVAPSPSNTGGIYLMDAYGRWSGPHYYLVPPFKPYGGYLPGPIGAGLMSGNLSPKLLMTKEAMTIGDMPLLGQKKAPEQACPPAPSAPGAPPMHSPPPMAPRPMPYGMPQPYGAMPGPMPYPMPYGAMPAPMPRPALPLPYGGMPMPMPYGGMPGAMPQPNMQMPYNAMPIYGSSPMPQPNLQMQMPWGGDPNRGRPMSYLQTQPGVYQAQSMTPPTGPMMPIPTFSVTPPVSPMMPGTSMMPGSPMMPGAMSMMPGMPMAPRMGASPYDNFQNFGPIDPFQPFNGFQAVQAPMPPRMDMVPLQAPRMDMAPTPPPKAGGAAYPTHPFTRSPRDFFMWGENMEDEQRMRTRPFPVPR